MKKILLTILMLLLATTLARTQSVSQVGFIMKKSVPNLEEIVILVAHNQKKTALKQAKMAQVITRKKFSVYPIKKKIDIVKKIRMITKRRNVAVYIITDDNFFKPDTIKTISDKLNERKIALFTNRDKDTMIGAMVVVFKKDGKLEKHVNLITASILKITIPAEYLKKCIIDVE